MFVPPPPPPPPRLLTPHFHFALELYVYITLTNNYLAFFIYQLIILWTITINWHRWLLVNNHISKYNSFILVLYRRYINYVSVCPPPPPPHTHFLAPSYATVYVCVCVCVCVCVSGVCVRKWCASLYIYVVSYEITVILTSICGTSNISMVTITLDIQSVVF